MSNERSWKACILSFLHIVFLKSRLELRSSFCTVGFVLFGCIGNITEPLY